MLNEKSVTSANGMSGAAIGSSMARPAMSVGLVIKRAVEVSESVGTLQQQAFMLAERLENLIERLAGPPPTGEAGKTSSGPAPREPRCAIDVLFEAVDGLDFQVNAIRSPFARISNALDRLETTLG